MQVIATRPAHTAWLPTLPKIAKWLSNKLRKFGNVHSARTHCSRDYSSLRNQRESPLLRLPAELRNRIYEYALIFSNITKQKTAIQSVFYTSRQVYKEIALLPFNVNIFEISHNDINGFLGA